MLQGVGNMLSSSRRKLLPRSMPLGEAVSYHSGCLAGPSAWVPMCKGS